MNSMLHSTGQNASDCPSKRLLQVLSHFTIQEHLEVQRQIEQCAYGFWRAQGCHTGNTLTNWVKAESLVLGQFIKARVLNKTQTGSATKPLLPGLVIAAPPRAASRPRALMAENCEIKK
jgi:hypothetical protein